MLLLSLVIAVSTVAPLDWHPSAQALASGCDAAVRGYRSAIEGLATSRAAANFSNVVLPLERAQADLDDATATARVLATAPGDAALQDAARTCRAQAASATEATAAMPALYARVGRAMRASRTLDASDRALGVRWLADLRNGGAESSPVARRELLLRRAELDAIEAAYDERPDQTLFARALATRDRIAHLLGYETWSAFAIGQTSLRSPMRAQKIVEETLARTHAATDTPAEQTLDPSIAAEHFPLEPTLAAIVATFGDLFSISIAPVDDTAWSPSVRTYAVRDAATDEVLGTIYLDLDARGDAGRSGATLLMPARADGAILRTPVAVVREMLPRSARRGPAHLEHAQVRTLVGDIGAATSLLLARTPYERLNRFAPEFAAVPNALFTRLAWEPSMLARLAASDPLPDAVITRLLATRQPVEDRELAGDAQLAEVDLTLHGAGRAADVASAWHALSDDDRAAIVHDGGFIAVDRPLAQLYAADLFTAFAAEPLDPAVGLRYRQEMLAPALSDAVLAEAARFLGRPLDLERVFSEVSS